MYSTVGSLLTLNASRLMTEVLTVQNLIAFGLLEKRKIDQDAVGGCLCDIVSISEEILKLLMEENKTTG